ncbi:hypothetical protein HD806DRAFT_547614 [Xylariaceae sp. AK1471]|nr:hypothetical protein HD806DRAFT_547614 [Xylariaceae sp. AK1471]
MGIADGFVMMRKDYKYQGFAPIFSSFITTLSSSRLQVPFHPIPYSALHLCTFFQKLFKMFFSKLLASAALLAVALASPLDASAVSNDDKLLAKRSNGVHLVNCVTYSAVVFCDNDSNCNFNPGPGNSCVAKDHLNSDGLNRWENSGACGFSTGVTFSWTIQSNGATQPNFSVVGTGSNGFQGFTIRKDDQHIMYTDGNGHACRSIYYAL